MKHAIRVPFLTLDIRTLSLRLHSLTALSLHSSKHSLKLVLVGGRKDPIIVYRIKINRKRGNSLIVCVLLHMFQTSLKVYQQSSVARKVY